MRVSYSEQILLSLESRLTTPNLAEIKNNYPKVELGGLPTKR
ncbi:hypothetical protein IFVP408_C2120318 [Vibrio parahaemolyticus]